MYDQKIYYLCMLFVENSIKPKDNQNNMTHKEAVRKALEILGGKGYLKQIYPIAIMLIGNNTKSVDIKATIRRELNSSPLYFKPTPGVTGCWELVEYQAELEALKASVAERDVIIAQQQAEIAELQRRETVEQYVKRQNNAVINTYKYQTDIIDAFRNIYDKMGLSDACQQLDHFINEQKQPYPFFQAHDYLGAGSTKQVTNIENYYGPKPDDQQKL